MNDRTLQVGALSIHVRSTEGPGTPVVLVHGNSCSGLVFDRQLESELGQRFRLIALDLPGHGASSRAADPDATYTLDGYASAIIEVARALEADGGVLVGWSLGGHALMEAMERLPNAAGFLIFGAPPLASMADVGEGLSTDPALQPAFRADSTDEEVQAYLRMFFTPGHPVPASFVEDFRRTDPRARACLAASLGRGEMRDEARIVGGLSQPLAVLHGVEERVAMRAYLDKVRMPSLWRGGVQEIAGAGHAVQWERPETFNGLLESFVLDVGGRA